MKTIIQSVNFDADAKLKAFINRKMDKLDQLNTDVIEGEVFLKVANNHTKENKIAEVKLSLPGNDLVVKKQCKTFEHATDLSVEVLRRRLKKYKAKHKALAS